MNQMFRSLLFGLLPRMQEAPGNRKSSGFMIEAGYFAESRRARVTESLLANKLHNPASFDRALW
jgi:hypothetical protein